MATYDWVTGLWTGQLDFAGKLGITWMLLVVLVEVTVYAISKLKVKKEKEPKYHRGTFLTKPRKVTKDVGKVISSPHMWQYENGIYVTSLMGMINGITGRFGYYLVADEVNQETKQFEGYKWVQASKLK